MGGLRQRKPSSIVRPDPFFIDRQWPEGFEFPSCLARIVGSSDHDLIAALTARLAVFEEGLVEADGKLNGLIASANRQSPGLIHSMLPNAREARDLNEHLGIRPAFGQSHQETGVAKIPSVMHSAIETLARKLSKGIFYTTTNSIFPSEGSLWFRWFTNVELVTDGKFVAFADLEDVAAVAPALTRSGKFLNNQFEYK